MVIHDSSNCFSSGNALGETLPDDCSVQTFPITSNCLNEQVSINCTKTETPSDRLLVNQLFTTSSFVMGQFCSKGITIQDLNNLKRQISIVLPWDDAYNTVRLNNNQSVQLFPMGICYPTSDEQVSMIVKWCVQYGIQMTVRSGGHSYESLSLCTGIVIDQSKRLNVNIDTMNNTVTSDSGVSIGSLVKYLEPYGLVVPTGTCASVHLFGLALGGGIGFLTRKLGLTSDNLKSIRYVLADGSIVNANQNENSDLFWAARGAGSSGFGVATSITLQAITLSNPVCLYSITWPVQNIIPVLSAWQDFAPFAIDDLSSEFNIFTGTKDIEMTGQYVGTKENCMDLLQPMIKIAKPTSVKIWHVSFADAVRYFSGTQRRTQYYKNRSDFVTKKLPPVAIQILVKYMKNMPYQDDGDRIEMDAFGGKVNQFTSTETAFPHRSNMIFWMQYVNRTNDVYLLPTKTEWLNMLYQEISPFVSGNTYWNCPDLLLSNQNSGRKPFPQCYFGPNVSRLKEIKKKYDPNNNFYFPQSIPM